LTKFGRAPTTMTRRERIERGSLAVRGFG